MKIFRPIDRTEANSCVSGHSDSEFCVNGGPPVTYQRSLNIPLLSFRTGINESNCLLEKLQLVTKRGVPTLQTEQRTFDHHQN